MTNKELNAIAKAILKRVPEFSVRGKRMLAPPIRNLLRGISFYASGSKRDFYVERFVLPLFIPTEHLHYLFGGRLRAGGWHADDPNLSLTLTQAIADARREYIEPILTVYDFIALADGLSQENLHTRNAIAMSWARVGNNKRAVFMIDQMLPGLSLSVPWQADIAERARGLRALLISDPAAAQRQLDAWEAETLRNLGLADFWPWYEELAASGMDLMPPPDKH